MKITFFKNNLIADQFNFKKKFYFYSLDRLKT